MARTRKLPVCWKCGGAIRASEYLREPDGTSRHLNACPLRRVYAPEVRKLEPEPEPGPEAQAFEEHLREHAPAPPEPPAPEPSEAEVDPDGENANRAEWALDAIDRFQEVTGLTEADGLDTAIMDFLCDLAHLCDTREDLDLEELCRRAFHHYQSETGGTGTQLDFAVDWE